MSVRFSRKRDELLGVIDETLFVLQSVRGMQWAQEERALALRWLETVTLARRGKDLKEAEPWVLMARARVALRLKHSPHVRASLSSDEVKRMVSEKKYQQLVSVLRQCSVQNVVDVFDEMAPLSSVDDPVAECALGFAMLVQFYHARVKNSPGLLHDRASAKVMGLVDDVEV